MRCMHASHINFPPPLFVISLSLSPFCAHITARRCKGEIGWMVGLAWLAWTGEKWKIQSSFQSEKEKKRSAGKKKTSFKLISFFSQNPEKETFWKDKGLVVCPILKGNRYSKHDIHAHSFFRRSPRRFVDVFALWLFLRRLRQQPQLRVLLGRRLRLLGRGGPLRTVRPASLLRQQ